MIHRKIFAALLLTLFAAPIAADDDVAAEIAKATAELDTTTYVFLYDFEPGEEIRYKVEHRATVDTKIEGNRQVTKSRTASTKLWKVEDVTDDTIKFVHMIEAVDMWQQSDGRDEIRYDSAKDETPPDQYEHVAKTIGKPLAVVTVNRSGQVLERNSGKTNPDLGFGGIIFPLPKGEVTIGHVWTTPKTLKLREGDGRVKQVKVQLRYKLEKVSLGVATISIKTEVLTPITDAKLKSQLVQQLSNGTLRFDIDAGRVLTKSLEWTETVIGFNGAASNMKYLAKFTEDLIDTKTADKSDSEVK